MMTKQEKSEKVYQVFEHISEGYDAANDRISLGFQKRWKQVLIRRLTIDLPFCGKMLDVCCGTGDIAIAAAKARPDLAIIGLDFSPSMLDEARKKVTGLEKICWKQGDAMHLPFEDNTFDAVTISFGLRNTPDFKGALTEMKRVLKPGGNLYCLDSFVPEQKAVLPFYRLYFQGVMPFIGGGKSHRKEYEWLWKSTESFLRESELARLLHKIRMKKIGRMRFMFGACVLFRAMK